MQYQGISPTTSVDRMPAASKPDRAGMPAARRRQLCILEISLITLGYYAVVWLIAPHLESNGLIPFMKALLAAFFCYMAYISPTLVHQDTLAQRGLGNWTTLFIRMDNLAVSARYYAGLALLGTAAAVGAAWWQKPALFAELAWSSLWLKLGLNLLNALGQDLLFLAFFLPRLKTIFYVPAPAGGRKGPASRRHGMKVSLGCALLFAIYHFPNLPLMAMVFILGLAVAYLYYHLPNLALAAATHAIIGTALHRVLEMHMRIGPFYWESDRYVYRTLFPFLRELIGNAF